MLMIGDLARLTGTKVNTIRFYEQIELLPQPSRTAARRRTYGESDVRRLSFIRHSRDLGFSIDEIRSLLALASNPDQSCSEAGAIAKRHLTRMEDRIARLSALRDELQRVAQSCAGGRIADCRVIEAIGDLS